MRTSEQTSANRVESFCRENVDSFFRNVNEVTAESFRPESIWNMDETGFSTVPTKVGKIISQKGAKRVGIMTSQELHKSFTRARNIGDDGIGG